MDSWGVGLIGVQTGKLLKSVGLPLGIGEDFDGSGSKSNGLLVSFTLALLIVSLLDSMIMSDIKAHSFVVCVVDIPYFSHRFSYIPLLI